MISRWYPDRGNFVALVGNISSRGVVAKFRRTWRDASSFPLETLTLPAPFSGVALSGQLSFWDQGFRAVMLSDTSFFRNPHYHELTDHPDTLDYRRMAHITEALVDVFSEDSLARKP